MINTVKPIVYMMLGLPGSGKSTFSSLLQDELGIAKLSLDEQYSRLGGDLRSQKWDEAIAVKANDFIKSRTKALVNQNQSVILDFCPWKKDERALYRNYVESLGAVCHVYYFEVPANELNRRILRRNESLKDGEHIVTPDMLQAFMNRFDPPDNEPFEIVSHKPTHTKNIHAPS